MESQQAPAKTSRSRGALYGLYIADALAMPVHWYYDRQALFRDYGWVTDYLAPKNPHPDSILWRSSYTAPDKKGEILHDQARYWGKRGVHYHQFLQPGENTLNVQLCSLLIESLNENGRYDPADYLQRYIRFMTFPGMHRDTYVEECHRHFFSQYALGFPPEQCGALEKHIGGLVGMVPLVVHYQEDPATAYEAAMTHLALTHKGPKMEDAGRLIIHLLLRALKGESLKKVLLDSIQQQKSPLLGHPFQAWLGKSDESVVGGQLSTACYVEDSVPAAIYLALKYADQPEKGLIVNTNLGGDNAYRGAVLGALLGAAKGVEAFPERWIRGLLKPPPELELGVRC